MSTIRKINLEYRYEGNNTFTLRVDAVASGLYIWQYCKYKTSEWTDIASNHDNTQKITASLSTNLGDKYRCLIKDNDQVQCFSVVFTVSSDKYVIKSSNDKKSDHNNRHQQQQSNRTGPSVEDTDGMDGIMFERYCANILRKNGFTNVVTTGVSGDFGVDILAEMNGITYAIQCKSYSNLVGNKAIQEVYSGKSFYGRMVAAVLTNNYFTKAAKETATRNSVLLWDRDFLDKMIKDPNRAGFDNRKKDERQNNTNTNTSTNNTVPSFFRGCHNYDEVKSRYKKLMQTYHPDLESGDEEYTKIINAQYEEQKKKYGQ